MKVLYAIQGTGNGHLSRARAVIPVLLSKNIELDLLISGIQADIDIPYNVKYRYHGLSFIFGKKGGVDVWRSYLKANASRLKTEINSLPIEEYDLVINDFEPISAWACKIKNIPCVSFSHQTAVLDEKSPKPEKPDLVGKLILKNYAPCVKRFGLHFNAYSNTIYTPIIRDTIRDSKPTKQEHYTVYLPSYSDERIIGVLSQIKNIRWHVFSKHCKIEKVEGNINVSPVSNQAFVKSMLSATGILCGAGFETPAEALFLKKKLMVIPMKGQYEQQCNAAALKAMGVPVLKTLKEKHILRIQEWILNNEIVTVNYPDQTDEIIDEIIEWGLVEKVKKEKQREFI